MSSWRVVIVTRVFPVAVGFHAALRELGHEPVALLTVRDTTGRYGGFELGPMLNELPADLSILMPSTRSAIAPLLASVQPDLVVCMGFPWRVPAAPLAWPHLRFTGFPWKVPAAALAVPHLGWLNSHPSLLPRHRGPVPIAWAIRAGDEEFGITVHRMEPELDAGPILAQRALPVGDYCEPDDFYGRMGPVVIELFQEALLELAAGEEGTRQPSGGEYESFFSDDDADLDPARSAVELHR